MYSDEEPADENETETEVEVDVDDEAPVYGSGPEVLVVTDGGMGKRSYVSTYRKTNRGAKGVVNIRLREGESVLSVIQITEEDEILLTTERGAAGADSGEGDPPRRPRLEGGADHEPQSGRPHHRRRQAD
ncbi:MAG: hypothetical protein L6W00_05875 [Lentisphaeria bacterium]|nr:MAG: hypothetical protein L6W00_05875 [Lentisphaeria bacterium]